jgi:2,3-dihydroxybiphenyl 1,2-dioxygenase
MASVTQLGYVGISAKDVDEWERFATGTLGLQVSGKEADGTLFLRMDEYQYRFAVHPNGNDDLAYTGWQVSGEPQLHEMADRIKAAGIDVVLADREEAKARRVEGLIKFDDPDGGATEIFYGPPICFDDPFNSPRPINGFVTGGQGLGHVVYYVNDLDRSMRFYRDVLGMRISDFIRNLAFFHCNPRHHSLALIEAEAPKRLNHFMLQLQSLNDVGALYDKCQDQEIPIVRGLGRHTNDHMTSFYLKSPSGFDIEWGWGAREVDDATWQVQRHEKGSIWGHRPPAVAAAG